MNGLFAFIDSFHRLMGREVLALAVVAAAIYLTVTYKPDAPRSWVARAFPVLIDIQVTLGIINWIYWLTTPLRDQYLSFPFILHPIIGFIAAGLAHMAVGKRNPLASLGRWAPLASLGVILVLVIANMLIAMSVPLSV